MLATAERKMPDAVRVKGNVRRYATAMLAASIAAMATSACRSYDSVRPAAEVLGGDAVERARIVRTGGRIQEVHHPRIDDGALVALPCSSCYADPITLDVDDVEGVIVRRVDMPRTILYTGVTAVAVFVFTGTMVSAMSIP